MAKRKTNNLWCDTRKGGNWYARVSVPKPYQKTVGYKQKMKTLRTTNKGTALKRRHHGVLAIMKEINRDAGTEVFPLGTNSGSSKMNTPQSSVTFTKPRTSPPVNQTTTTEDTTPLTSSGVSVDDAGVTSRMSKEKLTPMRKQTIDMCIEFLQGGGVTAICKKYKIKAPTLQQHLRKFLWIEIPEIMNEWAKKYEAEGQVVWLSWAFLLRERNNLRAAAGVNENKAKIISKPGVTKEPEKKDLPPSPSVATVMSSTGPRQTIREAEEIMAATAPAAKTVTKTPKREDMKLSHHMIELLHEVASDMGCDHDEAVFRISDQYLRSTGHYVEKDNDGDFRIIRMKRPR